MNKQLATWLVIGLSLGVGWRGLALLSEAKPARERNGESAGVITVSAEEFDQLASDPQAFVLDVHLPEQRHMPGTDAFIPYDKIAANRAKLPEKSDTPILVYCRSGSMSRQAGEELIRLGYTKVYDLAGGINSYKKSRAFVTVLPKVQELGVVSYGEIAQTQFILSNFTPVPLKITRLSTSCGCTTARVDQEVIDPYEETPVKVSFDPAVHQDDTDLGELSRTIYIETDHPDFSKLAVELTAEVVKSS